MRLDGADGGHADPSERLLGRIIAPPGPTAFGRAVGFASPRSASASSRLVRFSSAMDDGRFDVVVVGGGIVGLATAYRLLQRRPDLRLAVLEREPELAFHQSGHNSGVVHAGIYYPPGSLKARLCREGKEALESFCAAHGIPLQRVGKLIVALTDAEFPRLAELSDRGTANGVPGLELVGPERLRELEPPGGDRAEHDRWNGQGALRHRLRRAVVRPGRRTRRRPRPGRAAHRALSRRLLHARRRRTPPRARPHLPGPASGLSVPRGPSHAANRWRGVGRSQRGPRLLTYRLPAPRRVGPRSRRHADASGLPPPRVALREDGPRGAVARRLQGGLLRRRPALRPGTPYRAAPARPLGCPCTGRAQGWHAP